MFHWRNTNYSSNPPAAVDNIELSVPVVEPCETPTNLAVSSITQNEATATWTPGGSESAWIVQYKAASAANWTPVAATVNSYTMTGLTPNTQYQVRVQSACSDGSASSWTEPLTFTTLPEDTPEPCDVPTNVTIVDTQDESLTISWDANANVSSWNVQYRQQGTNTWSSTTTNTNSITITDLAVMVYYEIQVQADCGDGNTSDWSATVTGYTITPAVPEYLNAYITLYPNPTNDVINVQCTMNNVQVKAFEVFDVYGKLINPVETVCTPSLQTQINVSGLAAGVYFVRVTTEQGAVTKSFVKR